MKTKRSTALDAVTFEMIDSKMFAEYLDEIEANGGSVSTRNHRRACIRAFYNYAAKIEPTVIIYYDEICRVPAKKSAGPKGVEYMFIAKTDGILALWKKTAYSVNICI